jgi:nucleoid-associated protein YgaU
MDLGVPQIPFVAVGGKFEKALLKIVRPAGGGEIELRFNPTSYVITKANEYSAIAIPGLQTPPIQFVRGGDEKLTVDVLLDTTATQEDVRERYVNPIRDLMKINADLHAPPIVCFVWDKDLFQGVVASLTLTYSLFTPKGVPLRAEAKLALTAYRSVEDQAKDSRHSPDVEKSFTVRRGDRLDQIAQGAYHDAARWRDIARRNGIADPRRLDPGRLLLLPRIDPGRPG